MAKQQQYRRLLLLALLVAAAFAGLGYRLVDLQVLRHEELSTIAQQNTQREFRLQPRRGDILDARGNLLATSIFVKTVDADPTLIGDRYAEMARVLAPLLKLEEASLAERLKPRVIRVNTNGEPVFDRHVVLKRKVRVEEWQQLTNVLAHQSFGLNPSQLKGTNKLALLILQRKAIFTEEDQLRVYPNQSLAAHVLGFVGQSDQGEMSGIDGIERICDSKLRGVRGWRRTEFAGGRELVPMREQDVPPRDGLNVVLTIDSVIQHQLEAALADGMQKHSPISICGLVVRPRTGEILAMATLPNYDPNQPGAAPADARRNRVISDMMEPGSTFKIVVVSGALNDQTVRLDDAFDCEHGRFTFAGHVLHDHESYGVLSVKNIITKSSNIGAAKIGIKLGQDRLASYIAGYGFGARTGLLLPGEIPGIVRSNWSKVSIAQIPMGQGIAVTRLQMTMTMCAIANRGWLVRPMIINRLEDEDGRVVAQYAPQPIRQVVGEPAAKLMVEALKTVVTADGTAPKAALEHYTVAGKTGTAQKAIPGGYASDKFFASFIGFFPADDPELCISIVMDEPKDGHYGGQVAAPLFKDVAERAATYLSIRPDVTTPSNTVAEREPAGTMVVR